MDLTFVEVGKARGYFALSGVYEAIYSFSFYLSQSRSCMVQGASWWDFENAIFLAGFVDELARDVAIPFVKSTQFQLCDGRDTG